MSINNENGNAPTWSAFKVCWQHKRLYIVVCIVCILLAIAVFISIPNKYASIVKVADEPSEIDFLVGLDAYDAWIKQGLEDVNGKEGLLSIDIYSKFVKSKSFLEDLTTIYIPKYKMNYYDYLSKYHKRAWWNSVINRISLAIGASNKKEQVLDILKSNISSNISEKYSTITIRVDDNDAEVAALLADSIKVRLQEEIAEARHGVYKADFQNAKNEKDRLASLYHKAQEEYSDYLDSHFDSYDSQQEVKSTLESLQRERDAALNDYSEAYEQYVRTMILVNRDINSFSVLTNSTIALKPDSPILILYIFLFIFLGMVFTTWWVLLKRLLVESQIWK